MKQNIYDNPVFFNGYKQLRDNDTGLNGVLEEPAMHSLLPLLQGKRVLDLGCGMGNFAAYALGNGAVSYTGVDISANMIQVANERITHPEAVFVNCAIEDYAIEPENFDLIVSSLCLHYISNYKTVVSAVAKGLRAKGMFAFSVEHPVCTARLEYDEEGWYTNSKGEKLHWMLDNYLDEGERHTNWFVNGVVKYHRTVETYINTLIDAGLYIHRLLEPAAIPEALARRPELVEQSRRPVFLLVAATKP